VEQTTETENLAHRVLAALTAPTHKESQSPATTPDRERDGATTNFENTLRQLVEDIVCAGSNCPKKKNRALRADKITPIPQSFFLAGKRAEFFDGRKTAFFYVFEKPAIFAKKYTKWPFSYRKRSPIRKWTTFSFLKVHDLKSRSGNFLAPSRHRNPHHDPTPRSIQSPPPPGPSSPGRGPRAQKGTAHVAAAKASHAAATMA